MLIAEIDEYLGVFGFKTSMYGNTGWAS